LKIVDLTEDTRHKFTSWKHGKVDELNKTITNITALGLNLKQNQENNFFALNIFSLK